MQPDLSNQNATASGVVSYERPVEAEGGCVPAHTPTLNSV
ncbi:hypothetical protein A2U01_0097111 [Trifolium medium]|uniref:Uncharacterized protein n=1 Tax=Trifolium medium TaxID=97028 RepID=A0A392UQW9_9FABA|nr:hypothetical protein [Trifolium medium]